MNKYFVQAWTVPDGGVGSAASQFPYADGWMCVAEEKKTRVEKVEEGEEQ